jgi:hypothetical protein
MLRLAVVSLAMVGISSLCHAEEFCDHRPDEFGKATANGPVGSSETVEITCQGKIIAQCTATVKVAGKQVECTTAVVTPTQGDYACTGTPSGNPKPKMSGAGCYRAKKKEE